MNRMFVTTIWYWNHEKLPINNDSTQWWKSRTVLMSISIHSFKHFRNVHPFQHARRHTIDMSDVEVVGEVGQKASRSKLLEHKARITFN